MSAPFELRKPRIFVLADYYLPGFKAGGALRSVANIVAALHHEFDFYVLTRDRDWLDAEPYQGIKAETWQQAGGAQVFYSRAVSLRTIRRCLQAVRPDVIYLNSFFSPLTRRTLMLRRMGLIRNAQIVLAPRGEFSKGALELKRVKKKTWIEIAPRIGIYGGILWQASAAQEMAEICEALKARRVQVAESCRVAPDIAMVANGVRSEQRGKMQGQARFVFLSRIGPKKNLRFLLKALRRISRPAALDIYGPIDDAAYWSECQPLMRNTVHAIRYCGVVAPERVVATLAQYHFFVLPTLGENFGHVIVEAWAAGCPVLISDRTPWRQLQQKGAGFDARLDPERWAELLELCIDMDENTYERMSSAAREYAMTVTSNDTIEASRRLFAEAAGIELPAAPAAEPGQTGNLQLPAISCR